MEPLRWGAAPDTDTLFSERSTIVKIIDTDQVHNALSYPDMVDGLQEAFAGTFTQPPRQVFLLDDNPEKFDAFALLPAWNDKMIAVKAFTYYPSKQATLLAAVLQNHDL